MLNLQYLLLIGCTFLVSLIVGHYISIRVKLKYFVHKKFYNKSLSFLFKVFVASIPPIVFCLISIFFLASLIVAERFLYQNFFLTIDHQFIFAIFVLTLKTSLIWFVYQISNLTSINKFFNKFFIAIIILISLFKFLGIDSYLVYFLEGFKANFADIEVSFYNAGVFILIFAGVFWFSKILMEILHKSLETSNLKTNTKVLLIKFFSMVLITIAIVFSLSSSGLDLKSLTIFGSALVVGLGFGFQKLVSNVISGITISFEETIKEGDTIIIDDKREIYGIVKSLNMRYTLVAAFDGKEIIVPNDTIVTSNVMNLTHSNNLLRIMVNLTLPLEIDLESFRTNILIIMNNNAYASTVEECVFHIEKITEVGIHCFVYFWIDNSGDIFVARTSLLFEILKYIREKDIKIPAPVSKIEVAKKDFF
jgi:small-conductance mechanosensitive channel